MSTWRMICAFAIAALIGAAIGSAVMVQPRGAPRPVNASTSRLVVAGP
jgi:ABC-type nitrate/sulfonate/bicarbonate transport system permease component